MVEAEFPLMRILSTTALPTRIFHEGEDLIAFLLEALASLEREKLEGSVLAVTSKILSLAERRILPKGPQSKEAVIRQEADVFLGPMDHGSFLTIKDGLLMPTAGIDESNSETQSYILFPKNARRSAFQIRAALRTHFRLENFGVLITDSRTSPLRSGVTGVSLAHAGFRGLDNQVGKKDLFGRELKMTKINVADALSAAAVFCMGESDEGCPLALVHGSLNFPGPSENESDECKIALEEDLYRRWLVKRD
jgi:dihydrofolate synthase / folylpolyglutamate synthase